MVSALATRSAPGRPRSSAVDVAILTAALALFLEGGIEEIAFDQIAKRTGVSRAAIYRRWKSRDALLLAALEHLRSQSDQVFPDWGERPLDEIIDWLVEHAPATMLDPTYRRLLARGAGLWADRPALRAAYWDAVLKPRRAVFSRIIERARTLGRLPPGADPELIQDLLTGALLHRLLIDPAEPDAEGLRAYLIDVLRTIGLRIDRR